MVRSWQQSEWTAEDRALMLARDMYRRTLCPECGHEKAKAWHWDNEGWLEVTEAITCHACTAMGNHDHDGEKTPVRFLVVEYTRDEETNPLPPWHVERPDQAAIDEAMGGAA